MKHTVCKLSDLAQESNKAFTVEGQSVLLCRTSAGVFAVENRCTHQLAALEGGKMRGVHLFCPKHGARFDLRTGVPNQLAKTPLKTYVVEVVDDEVWIALPNGSQDPVRRNLMNDNERDKQTVRQFLEVFSSGNVEATLAMMTETATWWVAGTFPISGTYDKAAFKKLLSGVAEGCKGGAIMITPKAFTAEGERVAVEAESLAHTTNGRTYNNFYHFAFTVRDGKIAGVREYLDTMHANTILCTP